MKRTTRDRKNRKQRGSSGHGWGHKKKHRGAGSRGGRGNAGSGKRADTKKPTIINKYGTANLARRGFVRPDAKGYTGINVTDLNRLFETGKVQKDVNLNEMGFGKLLGSGKINHPLTITVDRASAKAIEKVKSAGGDVILTKQ